MRAKYDVTWWWRPGYVNAPGQWMPSDYSPTAREEIRRMGYVAHDGLRSIGAPEGEPSKDERDALIQWRAEGAR